MILRGSALAAATFLIFAGAKAAPEGNLAAVVLACSGQPDAATQLACYNRIAAQLKGAHTAAPPTVAIQPPPAPPDATARSTHAVAASPRPVVGSPEDFGKEGLRFEADAPAVLDHITARVAKVAYNYFHIFTVTLDNGQVWRQVDSDTRVARFKNDTSQTVTITRGFLDSFHLAIAGAWGDYQVKRIK